MGNGFQRLKKIGMLFFEWDRNLDTYEYGVDELNYKWESDDFLVLCDCCLSKNVNVEVILSRIPQRNRVDYLENYLPGGFFVLIFDKKDRKVNLFRDSSGVKTVYYNIHQKSFLLGTNVHKVYKRCNEKTGFNSLSIDMLFNLEFLYDGYTIYDSVSELVLGSEFTLMKSDLQPTISERKMNFAKQDNDLSLKQNIQKLREVTNKVHQNLSSEENVVFLSGGLDSCVMLAALHDTVGKDKIHNISFKVKGTEHDETVYAKSVSDHLGTSLEIIEVDPEDEISVEKFEEIVLKMNNPYIGYWIFNFEGNPNQKFFAGQDTRLHTPDVNKFDSFVFSTILSGLPMPLGKTSHKLGKALHSALNLDKSNKKALKHLHRIFGSLSKEEYIENYLFRLEKSRFEDLPNENYEAIKEILAVDYKGIKNKRQMYNEIVKIKWKEQYTDDIRYIQDMSWLNNTYTCLPFYDMEMSEFSSSIPFKYASLFIKGTDRFSSEEVNVNKYVLREAYSDVLNEEVLYRKKAVSMTNFLLFQGGLGRVVKKVVEQDLASKESFIKSQGIENFVTPMVKNDKWQLDDQTYLLTVYYIATMCIYHKNIVLS